MAYIFHQDDLPKLLSVVPGRKRVFFVSKELTATDAMLAGIMHYAEGRRLKAGLDAASLDPRSSGPRRA